MARYWVGGTANWDNTAGNKWSDTSGGAGGFSVPTSADDVYFDANSGVKTITVTENVAAKSLTCTGFTGTLDGSSNLTVAGNVTFVAGMTITATGTLTVNATATLTSNGKTWTGSLTLPTALSTTTFADNWYIIGTLSASNTTLEGGKTISVEGDVTTPVNNGVPASFCTVKFVNNGTQTLSTQGAIRANILIDKSGGSFTMLDASALGIRFFAPSFVVAGTNASTIVAPNLITFNVGGATIDTSPITWNNLTFTQTATYTLTSTLNVSGTLTHSAGTTLNGSDTIITGNLQIGTGTITGTSHHYIQGTANQTWSNTNTVAALRNNLTINKSGGTLTLGTLVTYNTGTLTYTAGTVDATGSTLTIGTSTTLNTNGITWNNVTFATVTGIYTLTTDFTVNGTFTQASGSNATFNGADIYCNGNVVVYANTGVYIIGTTDFFFAGTGTWSGRQAFASNLTITGTYTLSGTVAIRGNCTFTCTTGTLITTGSTFEIPNGSAANVVINTNQTLNNFSSGIATITLSQALVITGTLAYLNNATITINGFSITIGGSLTLPTAALATGTTDLILNGTGTWSGGTLKNPLTINTAGTITITGTVGYNTGTLTYTAGTVDASGSTLTIAASTTLNTNGITWNNITLSGSVTITNNSLLTINGTLNFGTSSQTFTGTHGWNTNNLITQTLVSSRTHTLKSGLTYTINNSFISIGNTNTIRTTFKSSVAASQAILTLNAGATQSLQFVNATDIDSSLGQQIYSYKGVLSNATNWFSTNGDFLVLAY